MEYLTSQVLDYFPYGEELRSFTSPLGSERYKTTHHERDRGTGLDYRGARYYDAALGRFLSVDPLAVDYASWSTYNYVLGNPILYGDPDGRQVDIEYVNADGETQVLTYQAGMSYEDWASINGHNAFVEHTIMALNYTYNDSKNNVIAQAIARKDIVTIFEVIEFGTGETLFTSEGGGLKGLKEGRIGFNAFEGLEVMADKGVDEYIDILLDNPEMSISERELAKQKIGGTGSIQSPALGLAHELGHFVNASKSWQAHLNRSRSPSVPGGPKWKDPEEKNVIKKWETPLARGLGEPIRTNAAGISRKVNSPLFFINNQ